MARRNSRTFQSRGRPNDYDWEGVTTTSLALSSAVVTEAQIFTADSSETLMRTRGELLVWMDASGSTAGDAAVVGCGLIVAPTGATVAVDPINEPGANWFWHNFSVLAVESPIGGAGQTSISGNDRVIIDNKAMRKLREDESVFFVVAN